MPVDICIIINPIPVTDSVTELAVTKRTIVSIDFSIVINVFYFISISFFS